MEKKRGAEGKDKEEEEDGEPGYGERSVHGSGSETVAESLSQDDHEDLPRTHTGRPQGFRLVGGIQSVFHKANKERGEWRESSRQK